MVCIFADIKFALLTHWTHISGTDIEIGNNLKYSVIRGVSKNTEGMAGHLSPTCDIIFSDRAVLAQMEIPQKAYFGDFYQVSSK